MIFETFLNRIFSSGIPSKEKLDDEECLNQELITKKRQLDEETNHLKRSLDNLEQNLTKIEKVSKSLC